MARQRIRTVKPEVFQHEELFLLEKESKLPMRVAFVGLWTCCDREGRFEWKPNILKLGILPWDDINFEAVLSCLAGAGFIKKYEADGKAYGRIPTWKLHQVINHRESPSVIPPDASSTCDPRVTDLPVGKGREGKGIEQKGTEGNWKGREGMQGKGNQEETKVSVSKTGDGDILVGQERLLELRRLMGISQDGVQASSFGKAGS